MARNIKQSDSKHKIMIRVRRHMIGGDSDGSPIGPFDTHEEADQAMVKLTTESYVQIDSELSRPTYTIDAGTAAKAD